MKYGIKTKRAYCAMCGKLTTTKRKSKYANIYYCFNCNKIMNILLDNTPFINGMKRVRALFYNFQFSVDEIIIRLMNSKD